MKTLKLIFLHTTKALSRSDLDQEFQIGCEITEIELKKISSSGFGSPGRRLHCYRRCSRAITLEFFVRRYRSLGGSRLLVRYFIPQSIKLTLLKSLVLSIFLLGLFEISPKSGKSSLPPSKDQHCLCHPNWEGAYLIGVKSRASSRSNRINNEEHVSFLEKNPTRNFFLEGSI